jgi:hypothetical protein
LQFAAGGENENVLLLQPKQQLQTFKDWAGKSSDISYYLNSHHIDFHEWIVGLSGKHCGMIRCFDDPLY